MVWGGGGAEEHRADAAINFNQCQKKSAPLDTAVDCNVLQSTAVIHYFGWRCSIKLIFMTKSAVFTSLTVIVIINQCAFRAHLVSASSSSETLLQ